VFDETWSEGYFYYMKIQKELGNHILSLSAMGAPHYLLYAIPLFTILPEKSEVSPNERAKAVS
jgi:hypothetical protein